MSENDLNVEEVEVTELHNDPDVKEFLEVVKVFLKDAEGLRKAVDTGRSKAFRMLAGERLDFLEIDIQALKGRIGTNKPKDKNRTSTPEDDMLELIDETAYFFKAIKEYKTDPINVFFPKRQSRFPWKISTPEWEKKRQEIEKIESLLNKAKTKVKLLQAQNYSKTLLECLKENNIIDVETQQLLGEQFSEDLAAFDVTHLREKISYAEGNKGTDFNSHYNCDLEETKQEMQQKVQSAYGLTEEQTKELSLEKLFIMTDYKFIPKFRDSIKKLKSQEASKKDGNSESLDKLLKNTNKIVESYNEISTLPQQSRLEKKKSERSKLSRELSEEQISQLAAEGGVKQDTNKSGGTVFSTISAFPKVSQRLFKFSSRR